MLVSISIVTHIMVVIVYISQKQIIFGKNKGATHINAGKPIFFGSFTAYTSLSS
jgi:hypothetical protein